MPIDFYIKFYFVIVITLLSENNVFVIFFIMCVCIIALLRAIKMFESRTACVDLYSCLWCVLRFS